MGRNILKRCPGCGEALNMATSRGKGAKCRTNGCCVQKVFIDEEGNIVDVLYSTEPVGAPVAPDQLRVMAEVGIP